MRNRSLDLRLRVGADEFELHFEVPLESVTAKELLPLLRPFSDALVQIGAQRADGPISCGPGCGACCRQIVPVSEAEIWAVAEYVDSLGEAERQVFSERFDQALETLAEHAVELPADGNLLSLDSEARADLAIRYFHAGVPCPFLVDESCGIHPIRPIRCREYLVTSPAGNCAHPDTAEIRGVEMKAKLSTPLYGTSVERRAIPLVLALWWSRNHRESLPRTPGPELLKKLLSNL
ncbi:MAG TPA: YkgJ family cysteine cluster protein [Bryobacteraceae bacterium]|nr:YkgJ family cysteine cluster protein [Bryobacteraceae bacterium]